MSISVPFPGCCCPPSVSAFMVLPRSLREKYTKKQPFIIRLLPRQNRSHSASLSATGIWLPRQELRRLYSQKLKALSQAVRETFGQDCQIQTGAAGTSLALTLPCSLTGSELTDRARNRGLGLEVLRENGAEVTLVLSCSSIPSKDFLPACQLLKEVTGS